MAIFHNHGRLHACLEYQSLSITLAPRVKVAYEFLGLSSIKERLYSELRQRSPPKMKEIRVGAGMENPASCRGSGVLFDIVISYPGPEPR